MARLAWLSPPHDGDTPAGVSNPSKSSQSVPLLLDVMALTDTRFSEKVANITNVTFFMKKGVGMACYSPLKAWNIAPPGQSPDLVWSEAVALRYARHVPVELPCRRCIGCRLDYSRSWADRGLLELMYHDQACFLTLTYDEVHVPRGIACDGTTGEVLGASLTLRSRDLTLFMKRLRKRVGAKIRFMACGEYGDHTLRPHYHAIIYGWSPTDLEHYSTSELGDDYYTSNFLDEVWSLGNVLVSGVTWDSIAYVARYVMKKVIGRGASTHYIEAGLEPEFFRCSRNPGIGRQYFEDHPTCVNHKELYVSTSEGSKTIRIPQYYKNLANVDTSKSLSASVKRNYHRKKIQNCLTDLLEGDILKVQEEALLKRISILKDRSIPDFM